MILMDSGTSGLENIRMIPYISTFKSVQIHAILMPLVKKVKKIGTSGTSKIVPVTKEIEALGLDVKDSVVVALAVPGSDEEYALDLASSFADPDVFYVNNRIMCSKNRYPNGQFIENRLNSKTNEDCKQALRRMTAMQDLIDVMREYTRNKVSGPCAYYNDELHSFVARFIPDEITYDGDYDWFGNIDAHLDLIKACVDADVFGRSLLNSVNVLRKDIDRAKCDIDALSGCPPEERDERCKHLNDVWNEEVNNVVYCDLFFIGCICQPDSSAVSSDSCSGPQFVVVPAPTRRMAMEKLKDIAGKTDGRSGSKVNIFGPYEYESECGDIVSYLRIKWKVEKNAPADVPVVAWIMNALNEYNNSVGE